MGQRRVTRARRSRLRKSMANQRPCRQVFSPSEARHAETRLLLFPCVTDCGHERQVFDSELVFVDVDLNHDHGPNRHRLCFNRLGNVSASACGPLNCRPLPRCTRLGAAPGIISLLGLAAHAIVIKAEWISDHFDGNSGFRYDVSKRSCSILPLLKPVHSLLSPRLTMKAMIYLLEYLQRPQGGSSKAILSKGVESWDRKLEATLAAD
jgi:hypothetical protein